MATSTANLPPRGHSFSDAVEQPVEADLEEPVEVERIVTDRRERRITLAGERRARATTPRSASPWASTDLVWCTTTATSHGRRRSSPGAFTGDGWWVPATLDGMADA
jgi:hypothetical protein